MMLVLVVVVASGARGEDIVSSSTLLERAEALVDEALASDDDLARRALGARASAHYRAILKRGADSAALRRAAGHAAWLAGEPGLAVAEFRRAERLDPTDVRTREGLQTLRAEIGAPVQSAHGTAWWLRWRGVVSRDVVLGASLVMWGLAWIAAVGCFAIAGARRPLGACGGALGVVSLFLGALLAMDRAELGSATHVVLLAETAGYTGPSEAVYEPAFATPIAAGWEGAVDASRDGWLRVRFRGLDEAWVPADSVLWVGSETPS